VAAVANGCAQPAVESPAAPAPGAAPVREDHGLACDESLKAAFRPDEQTTVLLVKHFRKGDSLLKTDYVAAYMKQAPADLCLVKLLVGPGNPGPQGAPSTSKGIGIEVWLPEKPVWNGRLHNTGGGSWTGSSEADLTRHSELALASDGRLAMEIAGEEGAVSSSTDTGHTGLLDASFALLPDGSINRVLWRDFSWRGIYEQAVKSRTLAEAYYGRPVQYAYWDAASTGGRQALKLAQMFPDLYDGIIAGQPAIYWSRLLTSGLYAQVVMQRDLGGVMPQGKIALISNAAISACDRVGGKHLGFILDPSQCRYDPAKDKAVLCESAGGRNRSADCVSRSEALALNKMWYGPTRDGSVPSPARDLGWREPKRGDKHLWAGFSRGTNLAFVTGPAPFGPNVENIAVALQNPKLAMPTFRNATGDGRNDWKNLSYADVARGSDQAARLQDALAGIDTDDPDLSAFAGSGGKLIMQHGTNDGAIPVQGPIWYFDRVRAKLGAAAVDRFFRFYVVPGMGHGLGQGTSNPDASPPIIAKRQVYALLTDWVEKGMAPSTRIEATSASQTGPVCAYPQKRSYRSGDPFVTASYDCR